MKIDPSIPAAWDGLNATRQFRGAVYNITVKNPDHVCKGIKSMVVDGTPIDGKVIPYVEGKTEYNVEVIMG